MSYTYHYTKLCYNDNMKCLNQSYMVCVLKVETQEGNGRPSMDGPGML